MKPGQVVTVSFNHLGDFSKAIRMGKDKTPLNYKPETTKESPKGK